MEVFAKSSLYCDDRGFYAPWGRMEQLISELP